MEVLQNLQEKKKMLHEALLKVKEGPTKDIGICTALYEQGYEIGKDGSYFRSLVRFWPKYSGETHYPVPSPNKYESASDAWVKYYDLWTGEYGKLRIELLDWLIEKTK